MDKIEYTTKKQDAALSKGAKGIVVNGLQVYRFVFSRISAIVEAGSSA